MQWLLYVWEYSKGLPPTQTFLPHTLYHVSAYCHKEEMFEAVRYVPSDQCSGKWRTKLKIYNAKSLFAIDCSTY